MNWFEALILGILQGLTEFLPVSSSGHLEIGKTVLGTDLESSLGFTVAVHGATVLSTIVVFRRELVDLIKGSLRFAWNKETSYILKIVLSMIPVLMVGFLLKDQVEGLFNGNLVLVGAMLLFTACLLSLTWLKKKDGKNPLGFLQAFIIGIAQAVAVIPGISRSGATIATGLLLGGKREEVSKFSFLMVLIPIIGANLLDLMEDKPSGGTDTLPLLIGFVAAFLSGLLACRIMIRLVNRGKLVYFAAYCAILGITAIIFA